MSVINPQGVQVRLDRSSAPIPAPGYRHKGDDRRRRNRRWLAYQREHGLTFEQLAKDFNRAKATVCRAIADAMADERAGDVVPDCPVKLAHQIQFEYPIGTEIGDNPDVIGWMAKMGVPRLTRAQVERMTPPPGCAVDSHDDDPEFANPSLRRFDEGDE